MFIMVCLSFGMHRCLLAHFSTAKLTGGHLKSGQHFKVIFLPYYGTQEKGCDIILNLIQNAIDLPNITAII